ncbi:PIF1-like helicase-domain-containing protein [Phlebopus sp. FC_14]|nr:PIF1-like helicase-domain-containing protein [Phlebopus sp. FC_14]
MSCPKSSQSGLRTVQRNWSTPSTTNDEPILWPQTKPAEPQRSLDSKAQRLKDIQDGLNGRDAFKNSLQSYTNITTAHIASGSKRPLPTSSKESVSKKRKLPWADDVSTSSSHSVVTIHASSSQPLTPSQPISSTTKSSSRLAGVSLSQEQTKILRLVDQKKSLFYTGSAGTGKSVLLREIIKSLRNTYRKSPDAVAITASTGIAACNIGGVTIHSFAGIGIGEGSVKDLIARVQRNKKASTRWARTKVLIIDESERLTNYARPLIMSLSLHGGW